MKNLAIIFIVCFAYTISAQNLSYKDRSPIYDYNNPLKSTDTIPGFETSTNKLKIEGVVYESDGVTPAKDVIVFINHADENGDFDLRKTDGKRYVHHRGWVKTDANGHYAFYTFVPGNDFRYKQLQQIFPTVKAPNSAPYEIGTFLFDEDPLLSKSCRKKIAKRDDPTRILKLKKEANGVLAAQRNIVLTPQGDTNYKEVPFADVATDEITYARE